MSNAETLFIFVVREWGMQVWLCAFVPAMLVVIGKPYGGVKLGFLCVVLNPLAVLLWWAGHPLVGSWEEALVKTLAGFGVWAWLFMVWLMWESWRKERKGGGE